MSHNLRIFLSDVTKSNFLLFADPFHKQLYQIDFTDSDPSPEGIHLPDSINYPEYFDIDVEAKVLYYANKLDKVITSLDMQDWRDRSIKQFNYGKSLMMIGSAFLKKNFLEDISPFCGATDTPVLDFWWRLLWVPNSNLAGKYFCLKRVANVIGIMERVHIFSDFKWLVTSQRNNHFVFLTS